ncbi:metallophosphoesterase [Clostridium sp. SYSU_GA19001]|uniref:metallophosphoesterase n=1 Tax=Clostridium caldaquaticum TaxID=2940653 RepID=UPI002077208C|nr:metallophosphoesterase [Clostridium caldaquaticum]MCM8710224.1 metallophosphoesterase [Clostridium caldaquaticum]
MKLFYRKIIITIAALCSILFFSITYSKDKDTSEKPELKFRNDGTFKIIQFADIQDGADIDKRTIALMERILDYEKPDLVVLTGDNIDGSCKSESDVRKAIDNIAKPMETRHIPWAVVFGNHDTDHGKMSKKEMMKVYMSYPYNISQEGLSNSDRVGNYNLLIKASKGSAPAFNIYMLDSGGYLSDTKEYDWIKPNQIA